MSLCLCLLRATACKDLYENENANQYMSYLLKFKHPYIAMVLEIFEFLWMWIDTSKNGLFDELMTYQNFEDLPLYD